MATNNFNISEFENLPEKIGEGKRVAIIKAEWNSEVTDALRDGALEVLNKYGSKSEVFEVPGTVELTFGAKKAIQTDRFDAVIVLGCVIQGETRHFDFVCQSITHGVTELNLRYEIPVIFGVLTVDNQQQALDRSGGKLGNKGSECAIAALKMMDLNTVL